ncbi:MAG: PHP domain-containing protein [Clostridiales bacterium]|nr:PHP domain-containing protein [Clostridiales bacterium]
MTKIYDLHIHTSYSDGELAPNDVLHLAKQKGAQTISVTDHDNVDFYFDKTAQLTAKNLNLKVVAGVELFCMAQGVPVEILAYGFDVNLMKNYLENNAINQKVIEQFRFDIFPKLFQKYGVKLELDYTKINFDNNNPGVSQEIFNCVLKNKEAKNLVLEENANAFDSINKFLRCTINNPKSKFYAFKNSNFSTCKKIINIVHKFGGLAFLAHPYEYIGCTDKILKYAVKLGVDGVECFHFTSLGEKENNYLVEFCNKNNLLISGGSDFHTTNINSNKNKIGEIGINKQMMDKILNKLK